MLLYSETPNTIQIYSEQKPVEINHLVYILYMAPYSQFIALGCRLTGLIQPCHYWLSVFFFSRQSCQSLFFSLKNSSLSNFKNSATLVGSFLFSNLTHLVEFPSHPRNVQPQSLTLLCQDDDEFFQRDNALCLTAIYFSSAPLPTLIIRFLLLIS